MKKEIYSGISLGLLIGVIIGLSIADVTGIILGSLTSLLAAFFGLRASKDGEIGNKITIGTFSIACVISIFIGLYFRTHNLLTPSLSEEIKELKEASFNDKEIKQIILFKEFGLIPEGSTFTKEAIQTNRNTVLMADERSTLYLCEIVDSTSNLSEIERAFIDTGGEYAEIAHSLKESISDTIALQKVFINLKNILCDN